MADKNNGVNDNGESLQEKGERSKSGKNKRRGKNRGPQAGSSESTSSSAADSIKSTSEQGVSNPSFHHFLSTFDKYIIHSQNIGLLQSCFYFYLRLRKMP